MKFRRVKRHLYRLRDKLYPKRPQTDIDIKNTLERPDIFEKYGKTLDGNHSLYLDSKVETDFAFHVFGSQAMMDMVRQKIAPVQRNYLIDGTFKIVPRTFAQLLIVAIEYKSDVSAHRKPTEQLF